jgi:hypothetical protein
MLRLSVFVEWNTVDEITTSSGATPDAVISELALELILQAIEASRSGWRYSRAPKADVYADRRGGPRVWPVHVSIPLQAESSNISARSGAHRRCYPL